MRETEDGRRIRAQLVAEIDRHHRLKGYSPTVRELSSSIDRAVGTTQRHIWRLEQDGYLTHAASTPRTMCLTEKAALLLSATPRPRDIVWPS